MLRESSTLRWLHNICTHRAFHCHPFAHFPFPTSRFSPISLRLIYGLVQLSSYYIRWGPAQTFPGCFRFQDKAKSRTSSWPKRGWGFIAIVVVVIVVIVSFESRSTAGSSGGTLTQRKSERKGRELHSERHKLAALLCYVWKVMPLNKYCVMRRLSMSMSASLQVCQLSVSLPLASNYVIKFGVFTCLI